MNTQAQSSATSTQGQVAAGGNITFKATGAGQGSNLTLQGQNVQAGGKVTLAADNQVNLLAAQDTASQQSNNQSKGTAVGATFALGGNQNGLSFQASANKALGNANGDSTTYNNTQVAAKQVQIDSGGDTTLKGAVVKADQVTANVGGNLNIESLQDSATYKDKQNSAGVGVSICVPPFCYGQAAIVNVSAAKTNINSDYQSVTQQSGLKAGDGGFTVNVQGNTDLKGAAITSTQAAIDQNKNTFNTGGKLTTSDIENKASYEAKSVSVSISTGGGGAAGFGSDSGQASSTTKAAISGVAGDTAARTGDKEAGIKPIFDAQKVKADVQLQTAVTGEFGRNASKAVGDYAAKQKEALNQQASQENDPTKKAALQAEAAKWEEGGAYRVAAHTVVGGLTGGVAGAAGAGTVSAAAPTLDEVQGQMTQALVKAGMEAKTAQGLAGAVTGVGAAGIGAAVSGGTTAGAATAFNADVNNRQLHPSEKQRIKDLAKGDPKKEARLTAAACALVQCYAEYPEGSATYNALKSMANAGNSDAMAVERQQLQAQQGLFTYSTQGVLSDKNFDAAKQINNTYQVTTRVAGAGQTVLGGLGVAGSVATAPVSCVTGVGCVANAVVGTLSADAALAGAKQVVSGQPENTSLNNTLQALGLSPEAANYAEFALGVGAAARAGSVVNAATNQASKMNELASSSYAKFSTNGVEPTAGVLNTPSVQALAQEIRMASPGISEVDFNRRLNEYLSSGSTIPLQATAGPGSVLVKVVPKGDEVSSYSPFWMSPEQVRSIAYMTPEQASKVLGLPSDVAWKMLNGGVDYYAITPKTGTTPKVFVSDIATTSQGTINTTPAAQQVLVPNRSQWTDPKPVNPFTLR